MKIFQKDTLKALRNRTAKNDSPVLSVYLNIDPSISMNAKGGYKVVLDQMLSRIEKAIENDPKLISHYEEDKNWVKKRVENLIPAGKTFIAFCDASENIFYEEEIPLRLANAVYYEPIPYIKPIVEAMDHYERYAIVLLDSEKARFFTLIFGKLDEIQDSINIPPVKYRKAPGSDHMRSQTVFQRRAETWTNWFLKDISSKIHDIVEEEDIQHIILMGPSEVTSDLYRFLPKGLQERVVARLRMSVKAKPDEILEVVMPVIEERERLSELRTVADLITTANKTTEKAVLGLNAVLDSINQGRVYLLVYPAGITLQGYYCLKCETLIDQVSASKKCPYCDTSMEGMEDVLWIASEKVLSYGGKVEEVKSEDARIRLIENGMVGAFLR